MLLAGDTSVAVTGLSFPHRVDTRHAGLGLAKGVPMGQQRRQFSPEFKADAVTLVRSSGRSIAAIAHDLGIGESNLGYWLKKDESGREISATLLRTVAHDIP
jgi:transposase-like protein